MPRTILLLGITAALVIAAVAATVAITRDDTPAQRPTAAEATQTEGSFRPPQTATTRPPSATSAGPAWSLPHVLSRIDGARVTIGGRRIPIRSETTLCSGIGTPRRTGGLPRWQAFDCTYTVFTGGIDRDLEFRINVLGPEDYLPSGLHWVGGR
jgi:hypothetical protein